MLQTKRNCGAKNEGKPWQAWTSECKRYIARNEVTCDGERIRSCTEKVDPGTVLIGGQPLDHPEGLLVAINKPKGYTCSHSQSEGRLVYELIPQQWLARNPAITSIGRLDKDTTGLLLLTTVTELVHKATSPKHKVPKRYAVALTSQATSEQQQDMVGSFASGDLCLHGEASPCAPAQLQFYSSTECSVTVVEGRYHQVRRMFVACGAHVEELHRESFGNIELDMLGLQQEFRIQAKLRNQRKSSEMKP